MEYVNAKTAAEKWGVCERRVRYYCMNHRVPGAVYLGKQWMVPIHAARPIDGRTKEGRAIGHETVYRFPLIAHSPAYVHPEKLEPEYTKLMEASLDQFKGDFDNSIRICNELLEQDPSPAVQGGIRVIMGLNHLYLGQHEAMNADLSAINKLGKEDGRHAEDFRLMHAWIKAHIGWNFRELRTIQPELLSPDAVDYFTAMLINMSSLRTIPESDAILRLYEVACKKADTDAMYPICVMDHALMASLYEHRGKRDDAMRHIKIACDVCIEQGWIAYLSKFYITSATPIRDYLLEANPEVLREIEERASHNDMVFKVVSTALAGTDPLAGLDSHDAELLVMVCSDLDEDTVSSTLRISKEMLKERMDSLYKKLDVSDLVGLKKAAKKMFSE